MRKTLILATTLMAGCAVLEPAIMPSSWQVVSVDGRAVAGNAGVTIDFAEGRIAGHTGCNRYTGPVSIGDDRIDVGILATTRAACLNDESASMESALLAQLDRVDGYRLGLGTLVLTFAGREVIRAERR